MPLEIEAKLKADSHAAVKDRLRALNATRLDAVLETNHIFDNTERTLLAGDCGLRIRTTQTETQQDPGATLTYKGPCQDSTFKSRQEIQVHVDDAANAQRMLEALGFIEVVCFEKKRESWRLDACQIELDELPYLGLYVEIEGPDEASVAHAQNALGLGGLSHITESYIALLVDHCNRQGFPLLRITFES